MSILFNTRKLADTFNHRNVVMTSRGHRNRLGELSFDLEFDFGKFGKWTNSVSFPTQDMLKATRALRRYQEVILGEIDVLEEIQRWSRTSMQHSFNKVLCEDKPMFFYAILKNETIHLKVFGEGLFNLDIVWDRRRETEATRDSFHEKIEELRMAMVDHLNQMENISMEVSPEGVVA